MTFFLSGTRSAAYYDNSKRIGISLCRRRSRRGPTSALAERRRRSPPNPGIGADFSSTEPHFDPPILLPTVRGVVRSDRQCISVSFDQGRYNALSLQLFGDCLRPLLRNYGIHPGSTVIIGEAEQEK